MNRKLIAIAVPVTWAAIVFLLHVMPVRIDSEDNFRIPHSDKVVHFIMFLVFSFFVARAQRPQLPGMIMIFLLSALYGGMLEWLQSTEWVQRDSDILDWCADLCGAATGLWIASSHWLPVFWKTEES